MKDFAKCLLSGAVGAVAVGLIVSAEQPTISDWHPAVAGLTQEIWNINALERENAQHFDDAMKLFRGMQEKKASEHYADISMNDAGFSFARNDLGSFPISIKNAVSFLDGYKITMEIGNPTEAEIDSSNLIIQYNINNSGNTAMGKSLSVDLPQDLLPGKWTDVEVVFSPAEATEISELHIWFNVNQISLNKPSQP